MSDVDVVVVGAGLAGLSAAWHLQRRGRDVLVLERDEHIGGRVRTDVVGGFRMDRGFQILLPAYPEVQAMLQLSRLGPCPFARALTVPAPDGSRRVLGDPRHEATTLRPRAAAPELSWRDLAALGALSARDALMPARHLIRARDTSTAAELQRWGLSDAARERVLRPFLSGVFLEDALTTSSRFFHLVWRSFARAAPIIPAEGMGALADQLAERLPPETIRLGARVTSVDSSRVVVESGEAISTDAVVVATDGATAARLLPGLRAPEWNSVTTFYHRTTPGFADGGVLATDPEGTFLNSVVLSDVASSYAPRGHALVSTSVLGVPRDRTGSETAVRERLAQLHQRDTREFEHVATYPIEHALPKLPAGQPLRRPVNLRTGVYVCGDHRDTPSIQGALFSGRRAARSLLDHQK